MYGNVDAFQAIILAGSGNSLSSLTSAKHPKSLLPVANHPMIYYQLKWLEQAQINNIIIITCSASRQKIYDYVHKHYEAPPDARIQVHVSEENGGTADAIRSVKDLITTDFIVLSTDLIVEVSPNIILDSHVALNSTVSVMYFESKASESNDSRAAKEGDVTDYVGIHHGKSRLLYQTSNIDVEDVLSVRVKLLKKFPILNIHTQLRDSHLYVFKKWVSDYINQNKNLISLKEDLLPILIKSQYDSNIAVKEDFQKYLVANSSFSDAFLLSTTGVPDGVHVPSYLEFSKKKRTDFDEVVVSAIVLKETDGLISRANTVSSYLDVNIKITKNQSGQKIKPNAEISPKTQVGQDSMIGSSTKIGERCSVKRSVIGAHCVVGKSCKISDSVIMDHVVIEDNVKLESCVVCTDGKILEKCQLKECEVPSGHVVEKETVAKGETFVDYYR